MLTRRATNPSRAVVGVHLALDGWRQASQAALGLVQHLSGRANTRRPVKHDNVARRRSHSWRLRLLAKGKVNVRASTVV